MSRGKNVIKWIEAKDVASVEKTVAKITCVHDKKNSTMFFKAYNNEEPIEEFKHNYLWHDEDDLCCKMQKKIDITATEFDEMWDKATMLPNGTEETTVFVRGE